MTYEQTIDTIKTFLDSPEAIQTLARHVDTFKSILKMVEVDAARAQNNEKVVKSIEDFGVVKNSINLLKVFVMELPITNGFRDFITAYGALVLNWKNNFFEQETDLAVDINYLVRFVQYHLTCVEVISILPSMIQKLYAMQRLTLPSIELARHYLDTQDGIVKKEAG